MCDCVKATDIVADAIPGTAFTAADLEMARTMPEDVEFQFSCGCSSEWPDHRCGVDRSFGCNCGAPDDCYCHEDCSIGNIEGSCWAHQESFRADIVEDHAEAILMDIARGMWK